MKQRKEMTLGFIGFGNMAKAIAEGFVRGNALRADQICACAKHWDKLCASAQQMGITACKDAQETVRRSDVIVAAVKPDQIEEAFASVRDMLDGKIIVSIALDWKNEKWEAFLPGTHHISIMPNMPVSVCDGIFLFETVHTLNEEEYNLCAEVFSFAGLVQPLDSNLFAIADAVTGCSPAFVGMFIEALGDAAVKYGLPRELAYRLASKMVCGTGRMLVESGMHPAALKDAVCSPGGSTIRGVAALERSGLRAAMINAVDAIQNR